MKEAYTSLSVAIEDLKTKGFTEDFNLVADGIESKSLKRQWKAGDLEVVKHYRFEGMTNPGDNTILYLIETTDNRKGLLVDVYGADYGNISADMIKKLSIRNKE